MTRTRTKSSQSRDRIRVAADTSYFWNNRHDCRHHNECLRREVKIETTEEVVDEAERRDVRIPPFADVREVPLGKEYRSMVTPPRDSGPSPTDMSVVRLRDELEAEGFEAYLVTDDDQLRAHSSKAITSAQLLTWALGAETSREVVGYVPRQTVDLEARGCA